MKAIEGRTGLTFTHVFPASLPSLNFGHPGGLWDLELDWYFANADLGSPEPLQPTVVRTDAFDIDRGVFMPDAFVAGIDVEPPDDGLLEVIANSGNIYTNDNDYSLYRSQILEGSTATLSAREDLPRKRFAFWFSVDSLFRKGTVGLGPTIGAPDRHDVVFHFEDNVVAYAFYHDDTRPQAPRADTFI